MSRVREVLRRMEEADRNLLHSYYDTGSPGPSFFSAKVPLEGVVCIWTALFLI
jgi:hypothetical protein